MSDCPMTRSIRRKFLRFSIGRTLNEAIWILWENGGRAKSYGS